jgi:hypothetical protein
MLLVHLTLAAPQDEIQHLLNHVANTPCTYERNGKKHTGSEAIKHIQRKYDYYSRKIKTAEDFIQYTATKSQLSGKYYKIHCPNTEAMTSRDWLLEELSAYRSLQKNQMHIQPNP